MSRKWYAISDGRASKRAAYPWCTRLPTAFNCRRRWKSGGVYIYEKAHTGASFIPGWLFYFVSCLNYDWVISYLFIWRYPSCWDSKSQTLRMRYPFLSTSRPISHRNVWSFRVYMMPLRDFLPEWNSRPGATTGVNSRRGDSRRHDIFWWYHVNKCRAMRGNRNELTPARKSPRCRVNSPSFRSWSGVGVLLDNPKVNTTSGIS